MKQTHLTSLVILEPSLVSLYQHRVFVFAREDMEGAVQSGDWREVREFYLTTFDSFIEINAAFKVEHINTHAIWLSAACLL